jgi:hypothetical protein
MGEGRFASLWSAIRQKKNVGNERECLPVTIFLHILGQK